MPPKSFDDHTGLATVVGNESDLSDGWIGRISGSLHTTVDSHLVAIDIFELPGGNHLSGRHL